jgi:hypothetical protein
MTRRPRVTPQPPPVRDVAFMQGYVCAVAQLVDLYDQPTMAEELLRALGEVDWSVIDEADLEPLRKAGLVSVAVAAPRGRAKR